MRGQAVARRVRRGIFRSPGNGKRFKLFRMMPTNVWTVALAALVTALATGLGAIPFCFVKSFSRWWLGISNAVATGLFRGRSHGLLWEGFR